MIKVRFLEGCYLFSVKKMYNANDIDVLDEAQAIKLKNRGIVDFLADDDYIDEETLKEEQELFCECEQGLDLACECEEEEEEIDLNQFKVAELQMFAKKYDIKYQGLRKSELIEALNEVI